MREIKFRAWDKNKKKMVRQDWCDPLLVVIAKNGRGAFEWTSEGGGGVEDALDSLILMQFTGLKDKNGKEIYEGDVFDGEDGAGNGFVFWNENHSCWGIDWDGLKEAFADYHIVGFEVIGNIYENPELVAKKEGVR